MHRWSTCGRTPALPPHSLGSPTPLSLGTVPCRWPQTHHTASGLPESYIQGNCSIWADGAHDEAAGSNVDAVGQPHVQSATAQQGAAAALMGAPDAWSLSSVGVRSSLVDTDSWYVQLRRRQQRNARVRSIAATGRDSYHHQWHCSSPQPLVTPAYSTTSSSIRNGKGGGAGIALAGRNSSPALSTRTGSGTAPGAATVPADIGPQAPAKCAAPASRDASRSQTCDSSILWVYTSAETGQGGNAHGTSSPAPINSHGGQDRWGKAHGGPDTHRIMFYSSETGAVHASSLHEVAATCSGRGLEALADLAQCRAAAGGTKDASAPTFWVDVGRATPHELHELADMFALHPLTIEDIEQGCSRDKIDVFGDYLFIVCHTVGTSQTDKWQSHYSYCRADSSIRPAAGRGDRRAAGGDAEEDGSEAGGGGGGGSGRICIVLKRNIVLTFHSGGQRDVMSRVVERLVAIGAAANAAEDDGGDDDGSGSSSSSSVADDLLGRLVDYPAYIAYAVLDEVTDQLAPEIVGIEQQVDAIDELVLVLSHAEHESVLQQMGEQRRRILRAWQLAQPKAEVVAALAKHLGGRSRGYGARQRSAVSLQADRALASEVVQYLGDVHEHLLAAADACSRAEAVLARSHSNYLAKISLELSRATFDSNSTTERWTLLGAIVVPINIVTSFLGVNLKIPGQDRDDTLNFFVVLACMVIYAAVTLGFWRWRRVA
ncbi:CorA metal ion transporter [Coemansia biformis]|uniref:CorA metal ion transporter n=1 Tax=Coemansia biformis TaxID=1286918 RepID=A0A9W7YHT8_9FUNG|nr:CorA metal ion transporter [Coemansia biformis]